MLHPSSFILHPFFRRLAFGIALLAIFANTSAQITITQNSFIPIGSNYLIYKSQDSVTVDLGASGGPQVWILPTVEFTPPRPINYLDPDSTPFVARYPSATHCLTSFQDDYAYFQLTSDTLLELGYGILYETDSTIVPYDPRPLELPIPLTYPHDPWYSLYESDLMISPDYEIHDYDSTLNFLDAYGVIVTPYGAPQVLRIFQHIFHITYTPNFPPDTLDYVQYIWVDFRGNIVCEIKGLEGNLDPDFTVGSIRLSVRTTVSVDDPDFILHPSSFILSSAYPNPFNPTTNLPVELSQSSTIALKIFNSLGQLVSENSYQLAPGSHLLPVNGSAWASGNYFARVSTQDFSQTTKIVLIK